ncbi:MAG TPA: response regulator transcription factor [Anaerolineae bacterium]
MIRVLIADDDASLRQVLGLLVQLEDDFQLVGTVADGQEAVDQVRQLRPDVVMMDLDMPRLDGFAATQRIRAMPGAPPVLIISNTFDDDTVRRALELGAGGFVAKPDAYSELAAAIREVSRSKRYFSQALAEWRSRNSSIG